jgi:hypothetical protein
MILSGICFGNGQKGDTTINPSPGLLINIGIAKELGSGYFLQKITY